MRYKGAFTLEMRQREANQNGTSLRMRDIERETQLYRLDAKVCARD